MGLWSLLCQLLASPRLPRSWATASWPKAYEDQAERAVRAELDAVQAVRDLMLNDDLALQTREQMHYVLGVIEHSCGVPEPPRLNSFHCRIVTHDDRSVPLDILYPPVIPREEEPLAVNA